MSCYLQLRLASSVESASIQWILSPFRECLQCRLWFLSDCSMTFFHIFFHTQEGPPLISTAIPSGSDVGRQNWEGKWFYLFEWCHNPIHICPQVLPQPSRPISRDLVTSNGLPATPKPSASDSLPGMRTFTCLLDDFKLQNILLWQPGDKRTVHNIHKVANMKNQK